MSANSNDEFIHALSGSISGCFSVFILYPLENLKTRMQVMTSKSTNNENQKEKEEIQLTELIKKIWEENGLKGFYSGVGPLCFGSFLSYGIFFYWYRFFNKKLGIQPNNVLGYTLTSFLAGTITTLATNPFWIINTRMTVDKTKKGAYQTLKELINEGGWASLLKGIRASLVLVLNPIIQFFIYEYLKNKYKNVKSQSLMIFLSGAISKAIATLITFPYQVIRTNIQVNKDKNIKEVVKTIYSKNGLEGFFKGLTPKLTQTVLNSALMLVIYEKLMNLVKLVILMIFKKK